MKSLLSFNLFEQLITTGETAGSLPERASIQDFYKWNLSHIYETEDLWEQEFKYIEDSIPKFKPFEGTLSTSAKQLHLCLLFQEEIFIKTERLYLYVMLAKDSDLRVSKYQGLDGRIKSLYTKVSAATSFIRPELLSIDEEKLSSYIFTYEPLNSYLHFFNDLLRSKRHTLSKEEEALLAASGEILSQSYDTYSIFTNADMKFSAIPDESGKEIQMSHGRYHAALYSKDRAYREKAFYAYYQPYQDYINTFSSLFNSNLKSKWFITKARKYQTSREAALDKNNIPLRVYDNLIHSVNENLAPMHRWIDLKKRILKVEKLYSYDVYVNLFDKEEDKKYSYEEGVKLVSDSLGIMGNEYLSILQTAFSSRWIDVYETAGKRSGAYSSGTTFGVHPYVLMNWNNLLNDVFTLAHEMGHNMHSYLTGKYQPAHYADYSIFLAEIASTFNESLLLDYLIEHAESREEKMMLIEKYLNNVASTFYRQTMFAEFEMIVYDLLEKGQALTPDVLREQYLGIYQKYMGPSLTTTVQEEYTWARIPHFYYNFYVFQYATGFAASESLALQVKQKGASAVEKYLSFLKAGKSDYALTILKNAGVDMTSPDPIVETTRKMERVLEELERLI